jgi:hypothetical protein
MTVMIGIDPHKATHTAVAVSDDEVVLDEFPLGLGPVDRRCCVEGSARCSARVPG